MQENLRKKNGRADFSVKDEKESSTGIIKHEKSFESLLSWSRAKYDQKANLFKNRKHEEPRKPVSNKEALRTLRIPPGRNVERIDKPSIFNIFRSLNDTSEKLDIPQISPGVLHKEKQNYYPDNLTEQSPPSQLPSTLPIGSSSEPSSLSPSPLKFTLKSSEAPLPPLPTVSPAEIRLPSGDTVEQVATKSGTLATSSDYFQVAFDNDMIDSIHNITLQYGKKEFGEIYKELDEFIASLQIRASNFFLGGSNMTRTFVKEVEEEGMEEAKQNRLKTKEMNSQTKALNDVTAGHRRMLDRLKLFLSRKATYQVHHFLEMVSKLEQYVGERDAEEMENFRAYKFFKFLEREQKIAKWEQKNRTKWLDGKGKAIPALPPDLEPLP